MLETNPDTVKRFAPPSQRNRSLSRRKSGDRFEKNFPYGIEGEKIQSSYPRNFQAIDHVDAGSSIFQTDSSHAGLIPIDGCCTSEAAQLLNERWAAAMHSYNDPSIDISERPIMYSGASGSSWGHLKLPHQMDFLGELRRAINNANSSTVPAARNHN